MEAIETDETLAQVKRGPCEKMNVKDISRKLETLEETSSYLHRSLDELTGEAIKIGKAWIEKQDECTLTVEETGQHLDSVFFYLNRKYKEFTKVKEKIADGNVAVTSEEDNSSQSFQTTMQSFSHKTDEGSAEVDMRINRQLLAKFGVLEGAVCSLERDMELIAQEQISLSESVKQEIKIANKCTGILVRKTDSLNTAVEKVHQEMRKFESRLTAVEEHGQQDMEKQHAPPIGKSGGHNRRPEVQMGQHVIKSEPITNDVKPLHQSEKPWKPSRKHFSAGEETDKASENDIVEAEGKLPLPPPAFEWRNSQDKSGQDLKSLTTAAPATQDVSNVIEESSPQPEAAPSSSKIPGPEVPVPSPVVQGEPSKSIDDVLSVTPSNVPNQNQPKEILTTSITSSNSLPLQAETFREQQPLDNGVSLHVHSEKVPSAPSDTSSVTSSQKMNHQAFNDENEPPKDSSSEQKEDSRMISRSADNDGAPIKSPSEKAGTKLKKEGKEKLQYDRAYLMELRECASSQTKPQGLQNLEIILDRAYGSAVNDARGQPGNSGRGGPPQQNLPQGGGYYQQPGQNMRPQQSQQGPTAHQQYFLSSPAPTGVRQRTPHPPSSSQPMVVYPQGFPGGNNVIIPNMNNWIPRKEQTDPKKIDEVHKDFQQEQATKQYLQSQPLPPRQETPQPGRRRGSRQRQDDNKPTDDGWNTVATKSLRMDASKMKLSKQTVVDENSIQLGPGGGMNKFSMWSRGTFGGGPPAQESERPAPAANRFSALRGEEDRGKSFQRSPSQGDSGVANRGMRQGPTAIDGRGKIMARSSQEGERREALASARSIVDGRSQNSSRDNSWNREDCHQALGPRDSREGENQMTRSDISLRPNTEFLLPPSTALASSVGRGPGADDVKKLKPMSEEEMEQKAKNILEEYLNVMDLKEAKLCIRELEGQAYLHALVTACINDVLERSNKDRELTGQFFHEMVKDNLISLDMYIKGLSEVLQFAEDMVIDIPMLWMYLAQMVVPLLIGGTLPWSKLSSALKAQDGGSCVKLLAEILHLAKDKTSEGEVAQMWQSSGLEWNSFMEPSEVDKFLKDKKLEFTVCPLSTGSPLKAVEPGQIDVERITNDIHKLVNDNKPNSDIISYIEKNVPADRQEKTFIRALMTAIASCCNSSTKKAEELIKSRKDVLQRYIKSNPELELQALYAIQALMHKLEHPSGVIAGFFGTLYDEDVINEEALKQWEKSSDPQELEGKGACTLQLTQFFAWLTENEDPEAPS